jgi:hypothetical protein
LEKFKLKSFKGFIVLLVLLAMATVSFAAPAKEVKPTVLPSVFSHLDAVLMSETDITKFQGSGSLWGLLKIRNAYSISNGYNNEMLGMGGYSISGTQAEYYAGLKAGKAHGRYYKKTGRYTFRPVASNFYEAGYRKGFSQGMR